jgi:hypothetical protein
MTFGTTAARTMRGLAFGTAIVAALGLATAQPAHALGPGAAVGIGLGAFAVGTAIGATANPYYYGYPGYYPGYAYPPAPAYYGYAPGPANSCWNPYYGRYYPC